MTKILSNADLIARHSTTGSRITLKIGSALLIDPETGQLRKAWLKSIARDVVFLRQKGYQVIIVSSGAIGLGRKILNLPPSRKLEDSQAAAAVGQIELATAYRSILGDLDIPMAQVLLTYGDTEERRRYLNARTTINRLLELGVVPVINENDTVATDEVRYGDNDRLAARVASMCEADCLFLLSDIDGLYSANPHKDPAARFIATVETVTPEIEAMAGAPISTGFGTGGMVTKIAAAKIASASGCHMVITNGTVEAPIQAWHDGARGTWFQGSGSPLAAKKKWIGASLDIAGSLIIDAGAVKALHSGKSLLPAGIVRIEGQFERGDILQVIAIDGTLIGQGLTAYGSHEAIKLIGHRSHEIEQILGYTGRNEMIHRNDLVTP
ncbi:glutamate 5-kinase [Paremcibacter congregatus]|uniref:Glutamate 5-kinase n=1 Tax=Paremcibacter congregatus TaxID=2043170 RepID=A0A2G4YPX5_9PROT|nr:glutamate 5-kinase [Paremcibacter congregatus]PHZ84382.1 glutamate 5-kinase [Paremcibacter congregatus]QDE28601.1 glutamate 5-kinase [Paremcibacter congregatus]